MNYTLIRQHEVQQGFFSQYQVTLFTVHLTVGPEHREFSHCQQFYGAYHSICLLCSRNDRRICKEALLFGLKNQLSKVSVWC